MGWVFLSFQYLPWPALRSRCILPVNPPLVFVGLTARLEEIYYGAYKFEQGIAVPVLPEGVVDVAELPQLPAGDWVGCGNAMPELGTKIQAVNGCFL